MKIGELYQVRHAEIFSALGCTAIGLWILLPHNSMNTTTYDELLAMASESTWGGLFLLNGMIHALALYINGYKWYTPFFRLAANVMACALYAAFVVGFFKANPATTAVPAYTVFGILMAASCAYRAYIDAITGARRKYHGLT